MKKTKMYTINANRSSVKQGPLLMIYIYEIFNECLVNAYVNAMHPTTIQFVIYVLYTTYTQNFS